MKFHVSNCQSKYSKLASYSFVTQLAFVLKVYKKTSEAVEGKFEGQLEIGGSGGGGGGGGGGGVCVCVWGGGGGGGGSILLSPILDPPLGALKHKGNHIQVYN